ncbi:hypothetical protein D3C86_1949180 [compost metagenome]
MQGPRAAVGVEREAGQVIASFGGYRANGAAHVGCRDAQDAFGRGLGFQAQRLRHALLDHVACGLGVHGHASVQQCDGVQPL